MIRQAVPRSKWSVMWKGKNGYMAEKRFEEDFGAALEFYVKVLGADKKWVTLRCCNAGFAPPRSITEHEQVSYQVVTRKGKRYKKKVIEYINLMEQHNAEGTWWCPFCIQLRRFYKDPDEPFRVVMRCPVCEVSHQDFHVKAYNPKAIELDLRPRRIRGKQRSRRQ